MANLNNDYNKIIEELVIKIAELESKQEELQQRLAKVEGIVNDIENDIYEDEDFNMEISCPYCNYDFTVDIGSGTEIKCPECNNIIELDWNDEYDGIGEEGLDFHGCSGSCGSCGGCHDDNEE